MGAPAALVFASDAAGALLGAAAFLASGALAGAGALLVAGLAEEHEFSLFPQVMVVFDLLKVILNGMGKTNRSEMMSLKMQSNHKVVNDHTHRPYRA